MKLILTLLILGNCLFSAVAQDEDKPFVLGIVEEVKSVQLCENRILNIYLPDGYSADSAALYPVVYLLDGSANEDFIHIVGIVNFLTMIEVMHPTIVVGIANVDRKRDFTFPTTIAEHAKSYPMTGHSRDFMAFVEEELQPYIEQNYHVSPRKIVIGQSLGGLVATEMLLKKPALFTDYIIVSPSLWWDNESLLSEVTGLLKGHSVKPQNIYIAVGNEGEQMVGDAEKLSALLQSETPRSLNVHFVSFPEENHLTILHRAVYKAFEIINHP